MEFVIALIIVLLVRSIVSGVILWVGTRLTGNDASLLALMLISFVASLFAFIPFAGGVVSGIVLWVLLAKVSTAGLWPEAFFIMVIAWGITLISSLLIVGAFQ